MVAMTVSTEHIEIVPVRRGGTRPRIIGTRIYVEDIVCDHYVRGWSAEQIVRKFPHLTLADVHAALTYYHDHKEEVDRQREEDRQFVEKMKRQAGPSLLDKKLAKIGLTRDEALERVRRGDPLSPR